MSVTEQIEQTEATERELLHRTFAAEMTAGDGRTIDVRIVPYGEPTTVDDGRGPFSEEFAPGAFEGQLNAAHRVYLNFEHHQGLRGIVGKGLSLREQSDGLHGSFRVFDGDDGDKALMLVNEQVLTGVSLEFLSKRAIRTAAGVVRRVKAHLDAVALCRTPAYESSLILAVREAPIFDEELLPVDPDPEMLARCAALGIELPQRYQAHPDPDTPAHADTSDTAPAEADSNTTSEE